MTQLQRVVIHEPHRFERELRMPRDLLHQQAAGGTGTCDQDPLGVPGPEPEAMPGHRPEQQPG